jgi:NAD(P)-dependent dehydrogenase (short-subunit alcohol dehydrogenase family)
MRRQRSGHIVQVSSLGGTTAFPGTGLYHASKWALEGLSESLALEVAPFGIGVTILEPGPFRTDWNGTSMDRAQPLAAYDQVLAQRRHQLSGAFAGSQPGDPRRAAQALLDVLASGQPPRRLLLGSAAADNAPRACQQRLAEWSQWEQLARSADFPE